MDIEIKNDDNELLHIILNEDLGITECDNFKKMIIPKINGKKNLIFDLSKVEYIDSSGISAFIAIKKEAEKTNTNMKLTNIDDIVKSVFKVTKLLKYFNIED